MRKLLAVTTTLAFVALMGAPSLASAAWWDAFVDRTTTNVSVSNTATVNNNVSSSASTGYNTANGGEGYEGGDGGEGGNAMGRRSVAGNGGNGGAGGAGGWGGVIVTGDALAGSAVTNTVNTTDLRVTGNDCGCDEGFFGNRNRTNVDLTNRATITNNVSASASTGNNTANGGDGDEGGDAGNGGDATSYWFFARGARAGNGGNGGAGGAGGWGGEIYTGDATALSEAVTVANTSVVRVQR